MQIRIPHIKPFLTFHLTQVRMAEIIKQITSHAVRYVQYEEYLYFLLGSQNCTANIEISLTVSQEE